MNDADVQKALRISIGDVPGVDDIAATILSFAKAKVARQNGVDFNRKWLTFDTTSGTSSYDVGSDILAANAKIWNAQDLWRTDVPDWPVELVGMSRFNSYARGRTASGPPRFCTIYGPPGERTLELYPTPDDAYTLGGTFELDMASLGAVFDRYPDIVFSQALAILAMSKSPMAAKQTAEQAMYELMVDGVTAWNGSTIHSSRHLDQSSSNRGHDSGYLR